MFNSCRVNSVERGLCMNYRMRKFKNEAWKAYYILYKFIILWYIIHIRKSIWFSWLTLHIESLGGDELIQGQGITQGGTGGLQDSHKSSLSIIICIFEHICIYILINIHAYVIHYSIYIYILGGQQKAENAEQIKRWESTWASLLKSVKHHLVQVVPP